MYQRTKTTSGKCRQKMKQSNICFSFCTIFTCSVIERLFILKEEFKMRTNNISKIRGLFKDFHGECQPLAWKYSGSDYQLKCAEIWYQTYERRYTELTTRGV